MKVLEIKNNLYQPLELVLNNGTQISIPKREKRYIKEELIFEKQLNKLKNRGSLKYKIINK